MHRDGYGVVCRLVIDERDGEPISLTTRPARYGRGVADPAGHWLAGDDGTVRLWDPIAGTSVAGLRVDGAVQTCIPVGSTGLIAAGGPRGLYLFQLVT